MSFLKSLIALFERNEQQTQTVADPTLYSVVTNKGAYTGKIVYQNDMVINFDCDGKRVKILKTNISRISIVRIAPRINQSTLGQTVFTRLSLR
jgi:hypothetical protein